MRITIKFEMNGKIYETKYGIDVDENKTEEEIGKILEESSSEYSQLLYRYFDEEE